jgi:hypothetical protein
VFLSEVFPPPRTKQKKGGAESAREQLTVGQQAPVRPRAAQEGFAAHCASRSPLAVGRSEGEGVGGVGSFVGGRDAAAAAAVVGRTVAVGSAEGA